MRVSLLKLRVDFQRILYNFGIPINCTFNVFNNHVIVLIIRLILNWSSNTSNAKILILHSYSINIKIADVQLFEYA